MRYKELITERRRQKTQVYYHGTSSVFVKSILKHGLVTDPKKRSYDSESDGYGDPAHDTISGGIYLTPSKKRAFDHAETSVELHGGRPIIVEVQYVIGSEEMDEDYITRIITKFSRLLGDDKRRLSVEEFVDQISNNYYVPAKKKFIQEFDTPDIKRISRKAKSKSISMLFEYIIDYLDDLSPDKKKQSIWLTMGSFLSEVRHDSKFESIIRDLMKQMSPSIDKYGDVSIRIPRNIGFSGKTKIVSIYDAEDTSKIYYKQRKNRIRKNVS
jgi:hypothetical protein